jgi:ADP-ribose pyrophosphatase
MTDGDHKGAGAARHEVVGFDVVDDARLGVGGFLHLRRLRLCTVRADGSRSREGLYDFVERPRGLDAVAVVVYHRAPDGRVEVLVREQLRVPISFGRPEGPVARPGQVHPAIFVPELVAGLIEPGEEHEAGIRRRAAAEVLEETGLTVAADQITPLGGALYATAGVCAERIYHMACEVKDPPRALAPLGDGSPFEEGARVAWLPLDEAIARCRRGEIPDQKTEVAFVRLRDLLAAGAP